MAEVPTVGDRLREHATLARQLGEAVRIGVAERRHFDEVETYCMFIGTGRSGHSLVGSLLDAHPDAVIAHELDALRYFGARFPRRLVYAQILQNDREFTRRGRRARLDYAYSVPNQWQGRYRRLRLIGDKKGGRSTRRLRDDPALLDRVRAAVKVDFRVVQVARNPFDTISTMFRRSGDPSRGITLETKIEHYRSLCRTLAIAGERLAPSEKFELRHEDFVTTPRRWLAELCAFLGLEADDAYLADCASILFTSPRQTRGDAPWTPEAIARVDETIAAYPFLAGYSFEGVAG
ncbi:MAG: sulfotransferase [Actinobacteria bacterium]|nr:sulfotransferase [Actinomycetota bacterium]